MFIKSQCQGSCSGGDHKGHASWTEEKETSISTYLGSAETILAEAFANFHNHQ